MDALVRTREPNAESGLDITSTFLTTSMLPKLAALHDRGRVIFFMTTNYQEKFGEAIKRRGRFDLLLCMWPPSWKNKVNQLRAFAGKALSGADILHCQTKLRDFTDSSISMRHFTVCNRWGTGNACVISTFQKTVCLPQ